MSTSAAAAPAVAPTISFTVAIADGPVTEDYGQERDGWSALLLIDPIRRTVTLYPRIGTDVPTDVWHRLRAVASVPPDAAGESVQRILTTQPALVAAILDAWQGTRYDGNNEIGVWARDALEAARRALETALESAARYTDPSAYLDASWAESRREVGQALAGGGEREAVLAGLASAWVAEARGVGLLLVESDVRACVERMASELAAEDA